MNHSLILLAFAIALCAGCQTVAEDEFPSELLQVVQTTMTGLSAHDSVALAQTLLPDAIIQRWQTDSAGVWKTVTLTGAEFASRLGQPGLAFLERTWRETAWVNGAVRFLGGRGVFALRGGRPDPCSRCGRHVARGHHFVHRRRGG